MPTIQAPSPQDVRRIDKVDVADNLSTLGGKLIQLEACYNKGIVVPFLATVISSRQRYGKIDLQVRATHNGTMAWVNDVDDVWVVES